MKKVEVRQQVEQALREQIARLHPGDRLPGVADLALEWHTGIYTVKSLLDRLADEGRIVRIPGKGTFVSDDASPSITTVAVIVPTLGQLEARLINTLVDALSNTGQQVMIGLSYGDAKQESRVIRQFRDYGAEAFVIMPADGVTYSDELLRLAADRCPTVLWDRWLPGLDICCVFGDHQQGAAMAVAELSRLGHQHIAAVSEVPVHFRQSLQERWDGFCLAVKDHALHGPPIGWSAESFVADSLRPSETFVGELVRKVEAYPEVTAYVALSASDTLAIAKAVALLGLEVPSDKSVIGFGLDNLFDPHTFDDQLGRSGIGGWTWVDQPEDQIGLETARLLASKDSEMGSDTTRRPIAMSLHRGRSCTSPRVVGLRSAEGVRG